MSVPLVLIRQDILKVSSISSNSCLVALVGANNPTSSSSTTNAASSSSQKQSTNDKDRTRIVVGDDSGELHCFSVRRGVIETDFKFRLPAADGPVRALSLGGVDGAKDKVFVSAEGVVRGLSKKGKEFFTLTTNLAEPFQSLKIFDVHLLGAGEFVYNHFIDGEDTNFVMCPDKVSCLAITNPIRTRLALNSRSISSSSSLNAPRVLIGCADRTVRVIFGSVIESELAVEGSVTALTIYENNNDETMKTSSSSSILNSIDTLFIYGCGSGHVGLVKLTEFADGSPSVLSKVYSFSSSTSTSSSSSSTSTDSFLNEERQGNAEGDNTSATSNVTSIAVFNRHGSDPNNNATTDRGAGNGEIVIARANGSIEIFAGISHQNQNSSMTNSTDTAPPCIATASVGELIRCITVACLSNQSYPEIIVATFSGRICSFATEAAFAEYDPTDKRGRSREASQRSHQLSTIKKEVEVLRAEMAKNQTSSSNKQGEVSVSTLPLSSTFTLNHIDASWRLSLESPVPIENVVLQSSIPIILPDAIGAAEDDGKNRSPQLSSDSSAFSSKTIISLASSQKVNGIVPGASVLATARSTERSTRIDVRVRALEGRAGELTALVSSSASSTSGPKASPRSCSIAKFQIKPLCLHIRLSEKVEDVVNNLESAWSEFIESRKKNSIIKNSSLTDATSSSEDNSNYDVDDDATSEALSAALATATRSSRIQQQSAASPPSSPGGTLEIDRGVSAKASSIALTSIAKNVTEETAPGAFDLSALSLTPAQSAPLKSIPKSFPWVTLTLQGGFSLAQIHEWVCGILPDVPAKMISSSVNQKGPTASGGAATTSSASGGDTRISLVFRNVFVGSYLLAEYKAGEAVFRSDNVSSISVLRDAIFVSSGSARVRLTKNSVEVPLFSMKRILSLLHARLIFYLTLKLRSELYEGLKEIVSASDPSDPTSRSGGLGGGLLSPPIFLHTEFADAYTNGPAYAAELASGVAQKAALVTGLVVDAYVDFHKLQGSDVTDKIPQLLTLLAQYHTQHLDGRVRVRGSDLVSLFVVKF
jgi:hypothetical protein